MPKKDKIISLRLSESVLDQIDKRCKELNLSRTDYINTLLDKGIIQCGTHDQEIARCLCKVQIALEKQGLQNADIAKEVKNVCHLLLL